MFDDGYAYNVVLTVNATNKLGGTAADWNNGGILETVLNPLALVAEYDIAKVADTQGTNHTLQFVPNYNVKNEANYDNFVAGQDVGLYTWAEAMRLFGYDVDDDNISTAGWSELEVDNQAGKFSIRKYKNINGKEYYIPNSKEIASIVPPFLLGQQTQAIQTHNPTADYNLQLVVFNDGWDAHLSIADKGIRRLGQISPSNYKEGLFGAQFGNEVLYPTEFYDEYLTKEDVSGTGNYITYAKRFIGTKYESAWRYEYKKGDLANGGNCLIIKNVMLSKNSGKILIDDIAKESFFNSNNVVERILPSYGYIKDKYTSSVNIIDFGFRGIYWTSSITNKYKSFNLSFYDVRTNTGDAKRVHGFAIRPFKKH